MQKSFLSVERGQVLVLFALAAVALFGIVGLAIDGGAKFSDRRHAQNAADSAVLAAALEKVTGLTEGKTDSVCSTTSGWTNSSFCLDIINTAWDRAEENGYDGLLPDSVDVFSPPISGPYIGNSSYVQVIITSYVNTTFARVVGVNQTRNIVEAVAFVRKGSVLGDGAMLISYDPDPNCSIGGAGGYSVQVNGNSTVNLSGGGIFLNSDEVCGFQIPNCADLNISSGTISSAGDNVDIPLGCTIDPPFTPNLNQDQIDIPKEVYWPDVPPECSMAGYPTPEYLGSVMAGSPPKLTEEWLIRPGYYTTFPQATLVAKKSHIYMASGVYCIDPGGPSSDADLSWSSVDSARLNGSTDPSTNKYHAKNPDGVTLYIRSGGGFVLNSNNPTFLDASTTGDYQGYLIILEGVHTSIENCSISGGADLEINGMIFAPYCDITVNGGSSSTAVINAQLLSWDIKINGGAGINFNFNPNNAVHLKRRIGLMR